MEDCSTISEKFPNMSFNVVVRTKNPSTIEQKKSCPIVAIQLKGEAKDMPPYEYTYPLKGYLGFIKGKYIPKFVSTIFECISLINLQFYVGKIKIITPACS